MADSSTGLPLATPEGPAELGDLSRRAALATGIFTLGYAAAIRPVNAAAIETDATGLVISEPGFKSGDFDLPAYVARPEGSGRKPVIIVVNEIFGIHAYIKDVCRRFAKKGFVAIAPAFFARAGDPSKLTDFTEIRKIVATAGIEQVMGDVKATTEWLALQSFADAGRIGITGFCWGGRVVWHAAAANPDIKAGAAWYGRLAGGAGASEAFPIDLVARLGAPVLGLYASNDRGIPQKDVDAMRAKLEAAPAKSAARRSNIIVYPGTEHGFHADYRPGFNASAAQDGMTRLFAFFEAAGVK